MHETYYSIICIFLAFLIGVSTVIQGGTNIVLSSWSGDPMRSTCIQFCIGTICLSPLLCYNKNNNALQNAITECNQNQMNYFVFLNGFLGVVYVCSAIYAAPVIGFGPFIVSLVIGEILTSTLIDQYALLWTKGRALSNLNIVGALMAVGGEIVFQMHSFESIATKQNDLFIAILCVAFAVFAGVCVTIQGALNMRLKTIMNDTAYKAAWASFANGSLILIVINCIIYSVREDWFIIHPQYFEWYMFFGGMLGAFVVTMFIICPLYIGFVTTYICVIFASMVTSVVLDYIGAFGVHVQKDDLSMWNIGGIIIVLIGSILVNIPTPSQNRKTQGEHVKPDTEDEPLKSGTVEDGMRYESDIALNSNVTVLNVT
eukprot:134484_1